MPNPITHLLINKTKSLTRMNLYGHFIPPCSTHSAVAFIETGSVVETLVNIHLTPHPSVARGTAAGELSEAYRWTGATTLTRWQATCSYHCRGGKGVTHTLAQSEHCMVCALQAVHIYSYASLNSIACETLFSVVFIEPIIYTMWELVQNNSVVFIRHPTTDKLDKLDKLTINTVGFRVLVTAVADFAPILLIASVVSIVVISC